MTLQNPIEGTHTPAASFFPALMDDIAAEISFWPSIPDYIRRAWLYVFHVDPIAWIETWAAGDWQAVSRASDMLKQFERYIQIMNENTSVHAWSFTQSWTGMASLEANQHFLAAQEQFAGVPELVKEAGEAAEWVASQMYAMAVRMSVLIGTLLDVVSTILTPTNLPALLPQFVGKLFKILGLLPVLLTHLSSSVADVQDAVVRLQAIPVVDLGAGYDHPYVT